MTRNLKKPKKKSSAKKGKANARPKMRPARAISPPQDKSLMAYRRLLLDPCMADLTLPPYMGGESGYLIRTRDVVVPFALSTSALYTASTMDAFVQWCPGNLGPAGLNTNFGIGLAGGAPSSNLTTVAGFKNYTSTAQFNFINSGNSPISSFRVVACCLKWIPTGPPLNRQGYVSLLSVPNTWVPNVAGGSVNIGDVEAACPFPGSNTTDNHEIVWIPGSRDQDYGALDASSTSDGFATLIAGLGGVDCSTTGAGTNASPSVTVPNGRFEITTVWQWTARINGGITVTLEAPPKHTVNDALHGIKDLGMAVYTGLRKAAPIVQRTLAIMA